MLGRSNVLCNRYGVGDLESSMAVTVNYPKDAVCTCTDGTRTLRAIDDIGLCVFYIPTAGDWTVNIKEKVENGDSDSKTITVGDGSKQNVNMAMYLTRKYLKNTLTSYSGNATSIVAYAFYGRTALTEAESESVASIGSYGFGDCTNLEKVDLKNSSPVTIAANAFNGASNLKDVIIRSDTVSTLSNVSAFTGTKLPITYGCRGGVFVPASLRDSYRSATNWSSMHYNILPLEEYPTDDYSSIRDSWSEIFAAEDNGTYSTKYRVGDTKSLIYNNATVYAQIAAIDGDERSNNNGYAKLTWIIIPILEQCTMNSTKDVTGGWAESALRSYLRSTCLARLPIDIQNRIVEVNKTYYDYSTTSTLSVADTVWIPSYREVTNTTTYESSGVQYSGLFGANTSDNRKIKYLNNSSTIAFWWLRSVDSSSSYYRVISRSGSATTNKAPPTATHGLILGFCT